MVGCVLPLPSPFPYPPSPLLHHSSSDYMYPFLSPSVYAVAQIFAADIINVACDWFHGLPQLFWKVAYVGYNISTCARVQLVAEAIDA